MRNATLLASELALLFRRRRTWAMLAALAAVPILIGVAVRLSSGPDTGHGPPFLDRVAGNGVFTALVGMLACIPLFLPLTIAVVAGDAIAGEAAHGTLRYLLLAPVSRPRLLVVKYIVAAVFCLAAVCVVALAGVLIGLALFPVGPVTMISGDVVSLGQGLGRIGLVAVYVAVSLLGLSALGLFISTLTDVPIGARSWPSSVAFVPTGWISPTCCANRCCGIRSGRTRCCRADTWWCSAPWPTGGSPPRTSCPEAMVPPWASRSSRQMDRPGPVPAPAAAQWFGEHF